MTFVFRAHWFDARLSHHVPTTILRGRSSRTFPYRATIEYRESQPKETLIDLYPDVKEKLRY